jgi:peptidoglycan/LPS O-acetylase OafA/YrhL
MALAQPLSQVNPQDPPVDQLAASAAHGGGSRNLTVDGLRGVAATLVVIYHLYYNTTSLLRAYVPDWLDRLVLTFGGTGVNVFFVLSGFVISMSLRGAPLSARYVGLFALRRSVRLDPPYWATMALAMFMAKLSAAVFAELRDRGHYSFGQVVAHLFYLQDILRYEPISSVFWTLCIELQFYLALVVLLTVSLRSRGAGPADRRQPIGVLSALTLLSLVVAVGHIRLPIDGLFVRYWHMFALGVLTCWCHFRDIPWKWWWLLMAAEVLVVFGVQTDLPRIAPVLAAATLVVAARQPPATKALFSGRVYQYLGRVSYSLYLVHPILGWTTISVLKKFLGQENAGLGLLYMAIGFVVSVAGAHILYRLIEYPALRLSKRVPLPRGFKAA